MKTLDYFNDIINDVTPNYIKKWKYNENNFTRNRKLPPYTLCLQMFANKGRSIKNELYDFYKEFKLNGNVSGWGYSKRRLEFNPLMIHEMNFDFIKKIYRNDKSLMKYKGYHILSIDGSDIRVPTTKENYQIFGYQNKQNHNMLNESCLASISCTYDCLNNYILDSQINRFKYSEVDSSIDHINNINNILSDDETLYVFDRGYFCFRLLYEVFNKNFIFRLRTVSLKKEQESLKTNDEMVNVPFTIRRRHLVKDYPEARTYFINNKINLRFVTIELPNGNKEVLVTNLTSDKMSYENIKELYHLRWNIETSYRTLKSQMKLEEFSGYLVDIIKQDIYISVMLYNLISGIINENKPDIDETKYKYKMKVNRNFSIGIIKSYLIQIILSDNEKKKTLQNEMIVQIQKHIIPIRKDINKERKRNTKNKCSMSYKKSF